MRQACVYIRFSTPKQGRGDSRDRQLRDARAYCERQGWNIVEVVEDPGRSAYKGDHLNSGSLGKIVKNLNDAKLAPWGGRGRTEGASRPCTVANEPSERAEAWLAWARGRLQASDPLAEGVEGLISATEQVSEWDYS